MREIKAKELKTILENHMHWLKEDCEDWQDMRANLSGAHLSCADLRDADLSCADLSGADLRCADLRCAHLRGAHLSCADLRDADLSGAHLSGADLRCADLRDADLSCADLSGADLRCANLRCAHLRDADLSGAHLSGADLRDADLRGAKNVPYIPMSCPDTGSFRGYKKANGYIVCLEIPAEARRSSSTGRKCRCNKAVVIEIQNIDGSKAKIEQIASEYDNKFIYKVGKTVEEPDFCEDRFKECAPGIHFFINRQEAVDYGTN